MSGIKVNAFLSFMAPVSNPKSCMNYMHDLAQVNLSLWVIFFFSEKQGKWVNMRNKLGKIVVLVI